jgi:hypothetical protein
LLEGNGASKVLELAESLLEGLAEAQSVQHTVVEALNEMVLVVHSYKLSVLRRSSEELRVLERVVQGTIRDLCQSVARPDIVPPAEVQALLSQQRGKLHFVTLTRTSTEAVAVAVHKSLDVLISSQLPGSPMPEEPVKFLPLLKFPIVYLSAAPFASYHEVTIGDLLAYPAFSTWCCLPNGSFLVTGTKAVHYNSGIISVNSRVFLFGGLAQNAESATVEMYDLYANAWVFLSDMLSPRSQFQPCRYLHFIYCLGGAFWSDASERLDLEKFCFEPVSLTIPGNLKILSISEAGMCYFFHKDGVYKWEPSGEPVKLMEGANCLSYMSPVRVGDMAYFFVLQNSTSSLVRFNLRSQSLETAFLYT